MASQAMALPVAGPPSVVDRRRHWSVFRAYTIYRMILVTTLMVVFFLDAEGRLFGVQDATLFQWTILGYMGFVFIGLIGSLVRKPVLSAQTHFQALVDLIALSLLIYCTGGISSNLNAFLIVAIAACGILLPLSSTLIAAALACVAVFSVWLYAAIAGPEGTAFADNFTQAALSLLTEKTAALSKLSILSGSFFIAGLLTYTLAERARRSENLAQQRSVELLEMAHLNQAIVQHLQSGIIVVDRLARVQLMNQTARELLSYDDPLNEAPLNEVSDALSQRMATWVSSGLHTARPFRQEEHLPDVTPVFSHLSSAGDSADTLIFLEDAAQLEQRVQRVKLAALGRLTASIAHEIRNPLASISHAAQLLNESSTVDTSDKRLGQIIYDNANRANRIINSVLDLSRREKAKPEDFELKSWLEEFCREFQRSKDGEAPPYIEMRVQPDDLIVRFDTSHLHQVLWNLFSNACVHGVKEGEKPRIRAAAWFNEARNRPILDVIDFGDGIPEDEQRQIFEPFFTTRTDGNGLGLYISREICEANRGQLQYLSPPEGGGCFRIVFATASKRVTK